MQVKILGSAAGGGFPQWNCACSNCARLRAGTLHGRARSQAQLAIREADNPLILINASPDLRSQILAERELHPQSGPRDTPIAGVVLTGADVDQVMGLLHLREFQPLHIYATPGVQQILREDNSLFRALEQAQPQAKWITLAAKQPLKLAAPNGADLHLQVTASLLDGGAPAYARRSKISSASAGDIVLGLSIESPSGASIFCAPSLPRIENSWLTDWDRRHAVLIDGTFWSDDELVRTRGGGKTAREMGHMPISGPGGTVESLAPLKRPRKIFFHINNTNPILDEDSDEHRAVREAGWEIAYDGMTIEL